MSKKKKKQQHRKHRQIATPYDDAFRSMYTRCERLVLFLLNEAFGTTYDGKETLQFLPNEAFLPLADNAGRKSSRKRISDSQFEVIDHDGNRRHFQIECQSSADTSMSVRILEYGLSFANTYAELSKTRVTATIQNTAVLYLRVNTETPDEYEIELVSPDNQSLIWKVPVIKAPKYSKAELFEKKLYFLIPFHFFAFESRFETMNTNENERQDFFNELGDILQQVEVLEQQRTLDSVEMFSIIDNCKVVLNALTTSFPQIKKGVTAIMARDYRTPSQKLYDKAIDKGRAEGRTEERLSSIRNVMKAFDVSVQKAMESLGIPKKEWDKYASQLR